MIKERTVLSCVFDMDTQPNHMYQPVLTIRYNCENKERPIHIIVRHGWNNNEYNYGFTEKFKELLKKNISKSLSFYLSELLPMYKGNKKVSELYISEFGKDLPFCNDHNIVIKNYFQ